MREELKTFVNDMESWMDSPYSGPNDQEEGLLKTWLREVDVLAETIKDKSKILDENPIGFVGSDGMTCGDFIKEVVLTASRVLGKWYKQNIDKGGAKELLFYRAMKDDFCSSAHVDQKNASEWQILYRCLRKLFYKSEPLQDATHYVLDYHQARRMNNGAAQNDDERIRQVGALAKTILQDFDRGFNSSVLTFNQLDIAVQKLLPDGLIYIGQAKNSAEDDPSPEFEEEFVLFEYAFCADDQKKLSYIRYSNSNLPLTTRIRFERTFANFATAPEESGIKYGDIVEDVRLRNRIYQLRFNSEQIRSPLESFEPNQVVITSDYDRRLSEDRLLSILYYGDDTYYFPAVVFFIDFVHSSRTQDERYTGGHFEGIHFVDRLLCRMTSRILAGGGFVDKSVYDQLFGIIKLPCVPARVRNNGKEKEKRNAILRGILPLFYDLRQIMDEEKDSVIKAGAAMASSFGLRIGATLCNVRNVVMGHPIAGIDFTVSGQGVILAARLEGYADPETNADKIDEKSVFSTRMDQNLMYGIYSAHFGDKNTVDFWGKWPLNNFERRIFEFPGLGGRSVFGICNDL